jgi:RNA polymerase I-specific transcription initiation factor RRN7
MSSHIDYHRFSRSEGCTEEGCRSKKWYIEDGKKFCQRGHEQTGFTQTQQDEDDWNTQGKTSRKKREEKEKFQTVLSGKEASELYLQCYQLILWKQCFWLVGKKGFPKELETVVRDLWGLRVRLLFGEKGDEGGYGSGTGTLGFSSTSEGENTDTDGAMSRSSRWSKKSAGKKKDQLPKLIETLALCYLGILLLRLPTSLGEIHNWVVTDEMIYNRAVSLSLPYVISCVRSHIAVY